MSHHINLKLASHEVKNASPIGKKTESKSASKRDTKKLEIDNKQMEWRLHQLKLAMEKEKEERSKQNFIWKSGKNGALESHARNVLGRTVKSKSAQKNEPKKVKVSVLTDEPLDIPKRNSHSKDLINKLMKPTPPKKKSVPSNATITVSKECWILIGMDRFSDDVMEVQSDRDGNLPLSAIQSLNSAAIGLFYMRYGRKRLLLAVDGKVMQPKTGWGSDPYYPYTSDLSPQKPKMDPTPPSSSRALAKKSPVMSTRNDEVHDDNTGSLLNGSFNEEENSKAFQEAVMAWRSSGNKENQSKNNEIKRLPGYPAVEMAVHDVQSDPVKEVEVKFSETSTLSFMEKILLNKHRRTDVPPLSNTQLNFGSVSSAVEEESGLTSEEMEERERYRMLFTPQPSNADDESCSNYSGVVCEISEAHGDADNTLQSSSFYFVNEASDDESNVVKDHEPENVISQSSSSLLANNDAKNKRQNVTSDSTVKTDATPAPLSSSTNNTEKPHVVTTSHTLISAVSNVPFNPDAVYQKTLDDYCSEMQAEQAKLHQSLSVNPKQIMLCSKENSNWPVSGMTQTNDYTEGNMSSDRVVIASEANKNDEEHAHEDIETLEKLEWELASQMGNITSDGRISRIIDNWSSDEIDTDLGIVNDPGFGSGLSTPDPEPITLVGTSWQDDDQMIEEFQRMENIMIGYESSDGGSKCSANSY